MAKGNMLLGMARKKVGDLVFYRSNGEQITRARNRNPRNPKSDKQSVQRMILATASKTAAILRPLINHSWEGVQVGAASVRHFQKKAMDIFRANAAYVINGGDDPAKAVFVIKGAPIPGVVDGLPISSGNISLNQVTAGSDLINMKLTEALAASIDTQEDYVAELAKLGLEPGDQLTIVFMANNNNQGVASYGNEYNYATIVRYARVVFVPTLPDDFSGALLSGDAFNPALIERTEGVWPNTSQSALGTLGAHLEFEPNLGDYALIAGTIIRSQRDMSGKVHYNPAVFHIDGANLDTNNAAEVWPSYGENAEAVNVGDELYLRNAVAAPFVSSERSTSPYIITPAFPITTASGQSFTIKKTSGEAWTSAEIEALKFTIDGDVISATAGSSVTWQISATDVLEVSRSSSYTDTLTVLERTSSHTITAVS